MLKVDITLINGMYRMHVLTSLYGFFLEPPEVTEKTELLNGVMGISSKGFVDRSPPSSSFG